MKRKFARRALSGLLSLLMVVGLLPFTAMAETVQNVTFSYEDTEGNDLTDVLPNLDPEITEYPTLLENYKIPTPKQTFYYDTETETLYVLYRIDRRYLTSDGSPIMMQSGSKPDSDGWRTGNVGIYEQTTSEVVFTTTATMEIRYRWKVITPDTEASLLNEIASLDRTVYSNNETVEPVENVYTVESRENLSVEYTTSMDMTKLQGWYEEDGEKIYVNQWNVLKMLYKGISDNSLINLIFTFDDAIDVENSDFSGATLISDMFVMDSADIVKDGQTVIIPCNWSGTLAAANNFDPMINLTGVKLSIKADADWIYDTDAGGYKLDIENYGVVRGMMYSGGGFVTGVIYGGEKTDAFTLISTEKVSVPGMNKTIVLDDGTEVDADTAAAGDTVDFKLNSTVPENLKEIIKYEVGAEGDEFADGTAEGTYTLTFHDQMDDAFVNPTGYVVKIGDRELTTEQYTIRTENLADGCDFEIDLDLAVLYNNEVITDTDLGITPITVTYTATLAEGTTAGEYYNTAWVTFPDDESAHDTVTVETFKIKIFKYDQANPETGLAGAVFTLTDGAGKEITVTSGEDGYAVIDGLDAGTYTLTETKAPDGYVKSDTPLTIVIPDNADGENVVSVSFANSQIPHTGGSGTLMFTIGGVVIIAMAGVLLLASRKKKKA